MIPFVTFESFRLGPLTIHVWGLLVAVGILMATALAAARGESRQIGRAQVMNGAFWVILGGLVGARLLYLLEEPAAWSLWKAVRLQDGGLSAFGAIMGGLLVGWWYARRHRLPFAKLFDAVGPAALLGEGIGRLGCFAIHDHLGRVTSVPWAIVVDGVPRHEVGLYLSLAGFAGWLLVSLLERRTSWRPGMIALITLSWYGLSRFLLDFLRAADLPVVDARYGGLTLAQVLALVSLGAIALLAARTYRASGVYTESGA